MCEIPIPRIPPHVRLCGQFTTHTEHEKSKCWDLVSDTLWSIGLTTESSDVRGKVWFRKKPMNLWVSENEEHGHGVGVCVNSTLLSDTLCYRSHRICLKGKDLVPKNLSNTLRWIVFTESVTRSNVWLWKKTMNLYYYNVRCTILNRSCRICLLLKMMEDCCLEEGIYFIMNQENEI